MNVQLSPQTQKLLEDRLKSGAYASPDDVVRAALEALNESEVYFGPGLDESALDAIDRAEDQIERGEVHDWAAVREQVRAKFLN
jgi:putative addiction module CopG family antidote